ncbi:hypothetical protein KMZ68_04420 [Bradyrhizobium sediminis]|uniref:Uncharacterized protein n=1 Tax=Bradyrhizobium sediminis TaxID=2840469 RepID=A0A975RTT6_9BRAD|nr:hypothetical protein [Bradyrhizobium sediminis]QWG19126.1 hypothetical protein KMZ68_04420 [Bradyrhizobium sediminis]
MPDAEARHRDLVAPADKALYNAKHLGRNRTELAETDAGSLAADISGEAGPGDGRPAAGKRSSAAGQLSRLRVL